MALDRPNISFTVKDLVIDNDLTVNGTTTTLSTTNTVVSDKLMELANGTSGTPSGDAGIIVERGSSTNAGFVWDESADTWVACTTSATGASTGDLTLTPAKVSASDATLTSTSTQLTLKYDADSSATVTVDGSSNTTIAAAESGDIILDAPDQIHLDSDGGMWKLLNGGALKAYIQDSSSDIVIHNETQDKDIKFSGNDDGSGVTALTLDMSDAGTATFSNDVKVTGDIIIDDGGSLKEAGGTAALTFDGDGHVTKIGQDTMLSGDVLTWDGSKFVGEAPTTGDITGVTAGVGLSGGGSSGAVTLTLDLSELSAVTPTVTDSFATLDSDGSTEQRTTITALSTLQAGAAATTGLSASSGVLSVSDLHPVGVDGVANQLLTDDGDGTVTSEGDLSFDGSTLAVTGALSTTTTATVGTDLTVSGGDITYGNGQDATMSITATAHDAVGKPLTVSAGTTTAGTTNNIAGGALTLKSGAGKGSGAGGDIIFQTANAGGSGSSINAHATALTLSDDLSATFTGVVTANAGIVVDNITIDSDDIILSSGPMVLQAAGGITLASVGQSVVLETNSRVQITKNSTIEYSITAGEIEFSKNQNSAVNIAATAHNAAGKNLTITAGPTTAGTTNNIAGGSLTLQGGQGKGSGAGGDIVFQTANAGVSGSSLNALVTALTISDDLSSTFAGGITSTATANTFGATSFNDADITNVGDIALDSISADSNDIDITLTDNRGSALEIKEGVNVYMDFKTTNSSERINVYQNIRFDAQKKMQFTDGDTYINSSTAGQLDLKADGKVFADGPFEIEQGASGGGACLLIDNDDTNQIALDIDAANIDANIIDIAAPDLTTSNALFIQADGLTSGNAINVVSNSASTTPRALVSLKNDHTSANDVTGISLVNDSLADGATCKVFNAAMGSNGSAIALKVIEKQVTFPNSGVDAELIVTSFIPAGAMPIALGVRMTTAITGGYVTKIGTPGDDDAFGTFGDDDLEQADDNFVCKYTPAAGGGNEVIYFSSNTHLKFTTNAVPSGTAGVARIALYYYGITAPTG